ncbi:sugar-binding domain-containing protein [Bacteroides sp.]|uniref:sugar-binding domain-containing protein n=1 Tax=Bacteroides sp. TaxID=29523 RepID=UPI003A9153BD
MKNILITLLSMLIPSSVIMAQYQNVQEKAPLMNAPLEKFVSQQKTLFNFNWKFQLVTEENKNADFASPSLDDSSWRVLDLPHDFQFEQPWTEAGGGARGFKPMCEGWYRKTFQADQLWKGKRVVMDFGGIIYLGDVYLNGHKIASTDYGYVGIEADLTPYLHFDKENVVAVYASTGPKKGSRWYTGGGLFRDVYLQVQNPTHIARHGIYITTPEVALDEAIVAIQVEVDGWQKHEVLVRTTVRNPEGKVVGSTQNTMPAHTHQACIELKLPAITLKDPQLWSYNTPQLYSADVVVVADGMVVDSITEQFGVRKLEFSPEFGFKLNGEKIFLQGNANHHDLGALGAASYDRAIERMMLQLKAFGYNTIRCSHNPYSDSFARIADRVGMLIVDELTDKWSDNDYWGGRRPFTQIWSDLIIEWIKRDRNRPSIILWSLGNELQIREGWVGFGGINDWGITTYRIFNQLVKRFDDSRLTTVAMFPARAGAITRHDKDFDSYLVPPELACATEVASFNYQSDKYAAYLQHKPALILFQSEAETNKLLEPFYNMDRKRTVGIAYWGSVEYWGESNKWPKKGWNYSFFDHTMHPYPQAYLIKSAFMPEVPEVHIGVVDAAGAESVSWNDVIVGRMALNERWNYEPGSKQSLFTYTNTHSVELLVNGKSIGTQLNDTTKINLRNMIYWKDVPYGNGGSLEAIARDKNGNEVARHRIESAGKAVALKIEAETPTDWKADGMDLQYINVTAVDKKGHPVWTYNEPLTLQIEGSARLVALDNGDHYTPDLFNGITTKRMHQGRMQIILRSNREAGEVKLKVTSAGLKETLRLKTIIN